MKILVVPELETSLSNLQPRPFLAAVCVYYLNILAQRCDYLEQPDDRLCTTRWEAGGKMTNNQRIGD